VAASEVELAELRAPLAGTVLRIHTRAGEQVRSQGVLDLADLTHMDAVAEVYETDVPQVHEGAPARVLLPGNLTLHGRVAEIGWSIRKQDLLDVDPVADIDTRVLEVRVRLDAAGAEAVRRRSNQRVQVVIEPPASASGAAAP
jgi:HlyD family secretion protein